MGAKMHMISISEEQEEWLNSSPEVSLSKITQSAIDEYIKNTKLSQDVIKQYQLKIQVLQNTLEKQRDLIAKHNLMGELYGDV